MMCLISAIIVSHPGHGLVSNFTCNGVGGPEAKNVFVYLKPASNFGPL